MPELKVGDPFPTSVKLTEHNPKTEVDLATIFKGHKVVVLGVPGAFTPTCQGVHLPSFLKDYDRLKAGGVSEIVCLSVNDAFVMDAWGKATNSSDKVRFLADASGELAKVSGLGFDAKPLGGLRFKRFSAVVEDGKVTQIHIEPDNTSATCSLAPNIKI